MKTYDLLYLKPFRNFLLSNGKNGKRIYVKMKVYGYTKSRNEEKSLFEAIPEIRDWYVRFIKEYVVSSLHTECFKNLSKDNTINMNECDIMFAKDLSARKMIVHNLSLGLYSDIFRIFENRKQLCSTETPDNIIGECLKPISIYDEPILFIPSVFTDYDDSSVIYFRFPSGLFILFTNNRYGAKELFAEEMINSIIKK